MTTLAFTGARIVDPASGHDGPGVLVVRDGVIEGIRSDVPSGAERIACDGAVLAPGLVDIRVGLREPGEEHKESLAGLAASAAAGGVTTLMALPDTDPPLDEPALVQFVARRAAAFGSVTVLPCAAATKGCAGRELAEMGLLKEAGAVAFGDGRRAIAEARTMRLALAYARGFGAMIVQHPEEPSLASGGAMNEGELATRLGLPGIPAAAEALMVARDLRLAELTGGHIHFGHVSTAEAIGLIRQAKARGVRVSCDTAPPYFDLNETAVGGWRTYAKLSPPLRAEEDRQAVVAALADGTIDAIASDHQPQDTDAKRLPFAQAEPGGAGLETLLSVTLGLVHGGALTLPAALALLTCRPADLLGLPVGRLSPGAPADLVLFDPDRAWQVREESLVGARNSPFDGRPMQGRVLGTWKAGVRVFG
ncbi:dihydroorotase [Elioraea tepida]|jgi:dihydroorotase|uniref:Dihydroorotase n=1 Tax=Elioraea tepida TaxID=2843330 RepID=A0A975U227_9PROT|nr:dihydroorotase [Elioraea tepida]QXM24976.1 dihydroorotase [Elioraea tepida]